MKKSIGAKTIAYPTPIYIIGSYDLENNPNMMAAAWGGICCSEPPCIAFSIRKSRYTFDNVIAKKAFTVNIPSVAFAKEADYFGMASGRKTNKLVDCNLTPIQSEIVDAPYISEFPLILECKLHSTVEIGSHIQFIGEIIDVKCDDNLLTDKGLPDIAKINPLIYAPGQSSYFGIGEFVGNAFALGKEIKK